jgi:hypothetical protein
LARGDERSPLHELLFDREEELLKQYQLSASKLRAMQVRSVGQFRQK